MKFSTVFSIIVLAISDASTSMVSAGSTLGGKQVNESLDDYHASDQSALMMVPPPSPDGAHLMLTGLDPSKPLTQAEASFLEKAVRDVFNELHEENGSGLVASYVMVANDVLVGDDGKSDGENTEENNNRSLLRGGRRNLAWFDHEMCEYQDGPMKGEIIPGCEFDIELYMDWYCNLCSQDEEDDIYNYPTSSPTVDFFKHLDDDDDWFKPSPAPTRLRDTEFFRNLDDDDDYVILIRDPTVARTVPPSSVPSAAPIDAPSAVPSTAPSATPSVRASNFPSSVPTEKDDIALEEERSPQQPNNPTSPFNQKLLQKFKNSHIHRFKRVKKIRFRGFP